MTSIPLSRRHFLSAAALLASAPASLSVLAQDRSSLEWVVGYAAGGGSDVVARTVAEQMTQALGGRPLVVNNKPGAATNIAADYVARAKGRTNIMLTADFATLAANPFLFSKLSYDAEKDFVPVGLLARFPLLVVVPASVPAKDFKELAAWARARPEGVGYASAGVGSPHHLAGELLRERSGLKLTHVAYRGAAPAVQDLLSGQVPMGVIDSASVQQYVLAGKLRAVGVASPKRLAAFPDVPTLAEQGLSGFEAYAWQGLVVPAGVPAAHVALLSKALQEALTSPKVKARFEEMALEALPGTPEQMAAYTKHERERWGKLIHDNGIKLE